MQLATPVQHTRIGTCPHGLSPGACPICSGMGGGGGGGRKADFSAKPGEMSWADCAAIGAMMKHQKEMNAQRSQDVQNFAQVAAAFQNTLTNASKKIATLAQFFTENFPPVIAKPANFVLGALNRLVSLFQMPQASQGQPAVQNQPTNISDKLAAVFGELKNAIEEKISKAFSDLKKKVKSLFKIFQPLDAQNEDKEIDETKKAFELRTFIHDLYKSVTELRAEEQAGLQSAGQAGSADSLQAREQDKLTRGDDE